PLVYWASSTEPRSHGFTVDSAHVWGSRYRFPAAVATKTPSFRQLDARASVTYSSAFPRTLNDGVAWAGRGVSAIVSAGGEVRWGPLTGRLYPSFVYAENRDFNLAVGPQSVRSPYAYPWQNGIDFPQRFGHDALAFADWGQSEIRLDYRVLT